VHRKSVFTAVGHLIAALLFAGGVGILALGLQRWRTESQVADVVHSFVDATLRGDRDGALACFDPARAAAIYAQQTSESDRAWKPSPGFFYRVGRVDVAADAAVVRVRIKQGEFVCEPIVELHPVDGRWRISQISDFQFRRYGTPADREAAPESTDLLAAELEKALSEQPGTTPRALASTPRDNQTTR